MVRHGRASLNNRKRTKRGRLGGRAEAKKRQQRALGGGSAVASATAVILLLRSSAAGGCAEGRRVEKTEERRPEGKERKGAPGQHCNSSSCSSLSGRKKGTGDRAKKKKAAGLTQRKHF